MCEHSTPPVQVRAVQTQFPQAHTHLLHSIRVSAPSSNTSSSRAHSARMEKEVRVQVNGQEVSFNPSTSIKCQSGSATLRDAGFCL